MSVLIYHLSNINIMIAIIITIPNIAINTDATRCSLKFFMATLMGCIVISANPISIRMATNARVIIRTHKNSRLIYALLIQ